MFFELSLEADRDLERINEYTLVNFGMDQAVKYIISFDDIFEKFLEDPFLGRQRQEIRSGVRRIIKEQNIAFYRVLEDRIRIVRIINAERDLPRQYFQ